MADALTDVRTNIILRCKWEYNGIFKIVILKIEGASERFTSFN